MSIYKEIITAVQPMRFELQRDGEHPELYMGRLVLAASALPDYEWSCLTAEAVTWVNAGAKRLNHHKPVEACEGFGDDSTSGTSDDVEKREVPSEVPPQNIALDMPIADSLLPIFDGVQPTGKHVKTGLFPYAEGESDADALHRLAETGITPALNKTDAIRALVIQHPEWTQVQIKEVVGDDSTLKTVATVRSVTLATIAVAKQLGKWVE